MTHFAVATDIHEISFKVNSGIKIIQHISFWRSVTDNNSGHLIDALHKKYHSALQKGNKVHYFSCTNH